MATIEVEWECTPQSGITFIDLTDLDCKSIKEWRELSRIEQKKRIKENLMIYDLSTVQFRPLSWYDSDEEL